MARISPTLCALRVAMSKVTMPRKHKNDRANNKVLIRRQGNPGRILTLPPADDSISLYSFGGEGWGEEAATPGSHSCPRLPSRLCPALSPRSAGGEREQPGGGAKLRPPLSAGQFFHCLSSGFAQYSRAYGIRTQAISVSSDRT